MSEREETPAEEFSRLVIEYNEGERQNRAEAWNLIADFALERCDTILRALRTPSPSPAPVVVTDAMVTKALSAFEKDHPHNRAAMRAALTAAIGAGGQAVAADIGDAVLGWMVKYDLLDGDNEYQVADVMAVMDDLVPSSALSQPHPADERVVEALHNAKVLLKALTGPDDAIAQATLAGIDAALAQEGR